MRHSAKTKLPSRDFAGARPLRYVNGRLYYVSNEMIDKIKRIPSQQKHGTPKPASVGQQIKEALS